MSATLLLAAAFLAPTPTFDAIKFGPKTGTKLTYSSTATTTFEGMGQAFTTSIKSSQTTEAGEVTDGWTLLKNTIIDYKVESDMPFGETPDPTGMVTSVLVSPTRKQKDPKVVSNGKMSADQVAILAATSKKDVESGYEGLILPEGELAVGTAWSHEAAPAGAGMAGMPTTTTGKLKTNYKVLEIKDGIAIVEAKTAGTFDMTIESPQGAITLNVKVDETKKYSLRTSDGVLTSTESTSTQVMGSDFGEFTTKTTSKSELKKD